MNNVIEVTNLSKRYGAQVAVDDVSFAVETGEIFGILGPNGAGKTTTIESIAGLRTPDAGGWLLCLVGGGPGQWGTLKIYSNQKRSGIHFYRLSKPKSICILLM